MNPQARRGTLPNQIRFTTDRQFASGCSPPRLATTQLPLASEVTTSSGMDLHHADYVHSQTHELGPHATLPRNGIRLQADTPSSAEGLRQPNAGLRWKALRYSTLICIDQSRFFEFPRTVSYLGRVPPDDALNVSQGGGVWAAGPMLDRNYPWTSSCRLARPSSMVRREADRAI